LSLAGHDDLQDYTTIPVFAIKGIYSDIIWNEPNLAEEWGG